MTRSVRIRLLYCSFIIKSIFPFLLGHVMSEVSGEDLALVKGMFCYHCCCLSSSNCEEMDLIGDLVFNLVLVTSTEFGDSNDIVCKVGAPSCAPVLVPHPIAVRQHTPGSVTSPGLLRPRRTDHVP